MKSYHIEKIKSKLNCIKVLASVAINKNSENVKLINNYCSEARYGFKEVIEETKKAEKYLIDLYKDGVGWSIINIDHLVEPIIKSKDEVVIEHYSHIAKTILNVLEDMAFDYAALDYQESQNVLNNSKNT